MLINPIERGPVKVVGFHDPDSKPLYKFVFRPDSWQSVTAYEKRYDHDYDVVMPTTYKGLYFAVYRPGLSGSTDPFTGTYKDGDKITDGTVTWVARNYNLMPIGVTITAATVTATESVTTSGQITGTTDLQFFIDPLPADYDATHFDVTVHVTFSNDVEIDRTLRFRTREQ